MVEVNPYLLRINSVSLNARRTNSDGDNVDNLVLNNVSLNEESS